MIQHNILYRGYRVPDCALNNLFGALSAFKMGVDTVLDARVDPDGLSEVSVYDMAGSFSSTVDTNDLWLVDAHDTVWYRDCNSDISTAATPYSALMAKVACGDIVFIGHTRVKLPKERH